MGNRLGKTGRFDFGSKDTLFFNYPKVRPPCGPRSFQGPWEYDTHADVNTFKRIHGPTYRGFYDPEEKGAKEEFVKFITTPSKRYDPTKEVSWFMVDIVNMV
jgi:hypothetical protein